jgi:hypothetical protein
MRGSVPVPFRRGLRQAGGAVHVVVVVLAQAVEVPLQPGLGRAVGLLVVLVLARQRDVRIDGGEAGRDEQAAHGEDAHQGHGREAALASKLAKYQMHAGPSAGLDGSAMRT